VLSVPLFSQLDNLSGEGYRECFTSSCAMLAAFHGRVSSDDEFNRVRARFGDTTDAMAQVLALKAVGLEAEFHQHWSRADLLRELRAGRPVAVGWLHQGKVTAPCGGGHWSVAAGYSPSGVWMLDPQGEADLVLGGYVSRGRAFRGWYSFRNWIPRWDVDFFGRPSNPSNPCGWVITSWKLDRSWGSK
jgi:hypothetical protein